MTMTRGSSQFDVVVVGGGPVGTTLAVALDAAGVDVALVEAKDPRSEMRPSFDGRTTALSNSSHNIFRALGLWDVVGESAAAITEIHVSESGRFAATRIEADGEGVDALGYTVENRKLGEAMNRALDGSSVNLIAPASLEALSSGVDCAAVRLAASGTARTVTARLIVGADGVRSATRTALGLPTDVHEYGQSAIVATVETSQLPRGRAFERFLPSGPLALLPGQGRRWGLVWTLAPERAVATAELDDAAFCKAAQRAIGFRAGRFLAAGPRSLFPLRRTLTRPVIGPRGVLVGAAANNLHPVAGQGFNLGLRDVAVLAEIVHTEVSCGRDPGLSAVLKAYVERRKSDHRVGAQFTHGLIELFGPNNALPQLARQVGLLAFDLLPGTKGLLARYAMGRGGWQPRLVRGVPLS